MKGIYSPHTRNTRYISDCDLFSSMDKESVEKFEKLGFKSKFELDRRTALEFMMQGSCKIAEDYIADTSKAERLYWETLKDVRKGNYCPIKTDNYAKHKKLEFFKSLGYDAKMRESVDNSVTDEYILAHVGTK